MARLGFINYLMNFNSEYVIAMIDEMTEADCIKSKRVYCKRDLIILKKMDN
jgi:hypothetical protein